MEWTEQFDPSLDFAPQGSVAVRYAICSTPRSGSHLLGQLLYATGRMGCPLEYFNRRNIVRWEQRAAAADAPDLMSFVSRIRTSPNGCFGLKAHYPHLRTLTRHISLDQFVSSYSHVHIVRRDLLAQAISFARAEQTGDWISRSPASGSRAVYDADLIRRCLVELGRQNASWQFFFHAFGLRPLVVEYEALTADTSAWVGRIAAFLGVELPADTPMAAPRTSRQRDEESEAWRERFVHQMRRTSSTYEDLDVLHHARARAIGPRWKRWVGALRNAGC